MVNATLIKSQIITLLNSTSNLELEEAKNQFAEQLATIIQSAIISATVTIPSGAIITVGSATTQSNVAPVTGSLL